MSNKACIGFAWVKDRGEALKTAMAYVESRMIPAKVQKDLEDCFYQIPSVRAQPAQYADGKPRRHGKPLLAESHVHILLSLLGTVSTSRHRHDASERSL